MVLKLSLVQQMVLESKSRFLEGKDFLKSQGKWNTQEDHKKNFDKGGVNHSHNEM